MMSWIVLCGSDIEFEEHELKQRLESGFPDYFPQARDDCGFIVGGPSPDPFMIKSTIPGASGLFMLMSSEGRYIGSEQTGWLADQPLRAAIATHRGWFSIDLLQDFGEDNDAYAFIGPAVALLAPPHATVLLHPEQQVALPFGPRIREQLVAGSAPTVWRGES